MNQPVKSRSYFGKLGAWVSILSNGILFVLKLILGILSGSVSLIADAVHTLSDIVTSLVVLISFIITAKPSDKQHPFGHGRAEFISTIFIALLLIATAFELLQSSIQRTLHPAPFNASWWIISTLMATIIFKEGLAWFTTRLSRKIRSDTLLADAWHHRLDAISSLLVVAAFIFTRLGYPYLDGPVGIVISLIIGYAAYQIIKRPIDQLLGSPPDEKLLSKIEMLTLKFSEVKGIHDVIVHNYGDISVISLHIEINENLTFREAHHIAEQVEQKLTTELDAHITVHYDPMMERTPLYREIEDIMQQFLRNTPECESFHDLQIDGERGDLKIWLDLVPASEPKHISSKKLVSLCKEHLKNLYPGINNITIKIDPKFSVSRESGRG